MAAKILIVEDDLFLVRAYEAKLTKEGFDVNIVNDGDAGFKALDTFKTDMVLLDLVMPGSDGFDFLEKVKEHPEFANIPILVASNLGQESDVNRVKELGVTDYVVKSDFSLNQLVQKIQETLKNRASKDE